MGARESGKEKGRKGEGESCGTIVSLTPVPFYHRRFAFKISFPSVFYGFAAGLSPDLPLITTTSTTPITGISRG